jgi:hypothetical protein
VIDGLLDGEEGNDSTRECLPEIYQRAADCHG